MKQIFALVSVLMVGVAAATEISGDGVQICDGDTIVVAGIAAAQSRVFAADVSGGFVRIAVTDLV